MNTQLDEIIERLRNIRDDVDAIYHHQTDRIVREIEDVVDKLGKLRSSKHRVG